MQNKRAFIASSSEAVHLAEALAQRLKWHYPSLELYKWYEEAAKHVGKATLAILKTYCETADFAIVFFTQDDVSLIRKQEFLTPRDNTIFELGLFMGSLDRDTSRCFIVCAAEQKSLPNDLAGITFVPFQEPSDKNNLQQCLEAVSNPAFVVATMIQAADPLSRHDRLDLISSQELRLRESSKSPAALNGSRVDTVLVSSAQPIEARDHMFASTVMEAIKSKRAKYEYFWGSFDENIENASEFLRTMAFVTLPEHLIDSNEPNLTQSQREIVDANLKAMRTGLSVHFLNRRRGGDFCIHNPHYQDQAVMYKSHPRGFVQWEQGQAAYKVGKALAKRCLVQLDHRHTCIFHCTDEFGFHAKSATHRAHAITQIERWLPAVREDVKLQGVFFEGL